MFNQGAVRGFSRLDFKDGNGEQCSIQESSACRDEGMLWLGIDTPEVKIFRAGRGGWQDVELPTDGDLLLSGRMHLSQSQAQELLPLLTFFASHGCLPGRESKIPPGVGCPCCRRDALDED